MYISHKTTSFPFPQAIFQIRTLGPKPYEIQPAGHEAPRNEIVQNHWQWMYPTHTSLNRRPFAHEDKYAASVTEATFTAYLGAENTGKDVEKFKFPSNMNQIK